MHSEYVTAVKQTRNSEVSPAGEPLLEDEMDLVRGKLQLDFSLLSQSKSFL